MGTVHSGTEFVAVPSAVHFLSEKLELFSPRRLVVLVHATGEATENVRRECGTRKNV